MEALVVESVSTNSDPMREEKVVNDDVVLHVEYAVITLPLTE